MTLQEFADESGVRWRVWHVTTPAESAHLMNAGFRNGWLVFEREDGSDRRRLGQFPADWSSLSAHRLSLLCQVATPVGALVTGQQSVNLPPDSSKP